MRFSTTSLNRLDSSMNLCWAVLEHYAVAVVVYVFCTSIGLFVDLQVTFGNSSSTFARGTIQVIVPRALQPPLFDMELYNFTVPENAADGHQIGRLDVTIETCKFK